MLATEMHFHFCLKLAGQNSTLKIAQLGKVFQLPNTTKHLILKNNLLNQRLNILEKQEIFLKGIVNSFISN